MHRQPLVATQSYESDLRGIKAHRKQVLSGSATERKRKALQFLVAAGIATPKGKLTSKYR